MIEFQNENSIYYYFLKMKMRRGFENENHE